MFLKVIEMHPEILQGILSTIINIVMFEDCKNQWSLSRPLLGLILLYEDYFRYACNLYPFVLFCTVQTMQCSTNPLLLFVLLDQ